MEFYVEDSKKLPVIAEVDVLVAGGGPAGIGAAIRAGRMGVKTMVIEAQNCLGGVATAGMMSHWGRTFISLADISHSKIFARVRSRL